MAPKRSPKVTSLSSSSAASAASPSQGRNANPFRPVDPTSYHDYDQAMQDGVELEEKGERFQFGSKAHRFYLQAGTLYDRAVRLAGANSMRRADALYNASRIYYLLASQFVLPPESLSLFKQAIDTVQDAVSLAPPLPPARSSHGALPDPFTLDALTHMATSLQSLAEATEELNWPLALSPPSLASIDPSQTPTPKSLWQEAATIFQQVADGQEVILQDHEQAGNSNKDSNEPVDQVPVDAQAEDVEPVAAGSEEDVFGYTSSLVTSSSLMETLLSLVACFTSLLEASISVEEMQTAKAAVDQNVARAHQLVSKAAASSGISQADTELAAKWDELQRGALAARAAWLIKAVDLGADAAHVASELQSAMQAVSEWAGRLSAPPLANEGGARRKDTHVATLCDVAEAGYNLCRLSLRLEPAEAGVAAIWALATTSTKLFTQALAALNTSTGGGGSAAVLGQANTSTPTSRARCRILLVLCALSIFRSHPGFEAAGIAGAKGTRTKLIDNARLYARKAVSEIGLGWLLRPAPAQTPRSIVVPPPGGWESLSLESEAIFHLLRALLVRAHTNAAVASDANSASAMQTELRDVACHVVQLQQRPIQIGATPTANSVELSSLLYLHGAKTYVDAIVDDNGRNVVSQEIEWWEQLFASQLAVA